VGFFCLLVWLSGLLQHCSWVFHLVVVVILYCSSLSFLGLTIVVRTLCGGLDKHYGLLTKSGLITSIVYGIIPTSTSQLIF
jgi:hypothetical protein